MQKPFKETAREYGASYVEVEREMQAAIQQAWANSSLTEAGKSEQNKVASKGIIPRKN